MTVLTNPTPVFYDGRGVPLTGGYIYVGAANGSPTTAPLDLFWDESLLTPAEQPLRTIGGLIVNGVTPAAVFLAETDFSLQVTDSNGSQILYAPSLNTNLDSFQPKDDDLTAIAVQGTTSYGRSLLTLQNQEALINAIGGNAYLASNGGEITGNIVRQGAGVHVYWSDTRMTGGRIYTSGSGSPDPTSQPGDIWLVTE
jgi:hypothetical protein